ncbi:MAG: acyltransferase [Sphingomonas bacterium]|nr:acyltransferase [Sphingomonas bacterium]
MSAIDLNIADQATPSEPRVAKLLGLELVRFTCAMAVLVWHYHHFAMVGDGAAMYGAHQPLEWLLYPFYHFGLFGVQVFWCISGFIFYWKYADPLAARRVEPKRFFFLRFSRLYPLHFATLLLVAALQPIYTALTGHAFVFEENSATRFVLQLFLADQWAGSHAMSFNGPIWSVSAEVFVYVGFFLLLRSFGKTPWLIVGAVGASLASLWSGAISPALICGGYFFAGGAAAQWLASDRCRQRPVEARWFALAIVALCLAAAPFLDLGREDSDVLATWLMVLVPPTLLLAAQDWRHLERYQRQIQAAGNLTYSTYLIHFPLQLAVAIAALASGIALPVGEAWFLIAYLAAAIIIGRIVFVRFEAPAQAMIRAATLTKRARATA